MVTQFFVSRQSLSLQYLWSLCPLFLQKYLLKVPTISGYSHGCSDAKLSDPDKRYINQPGMGPSYHTSQFMNGYNDGYNDCHKVNPQSPSSNNMFKVIVEVTNHSFRDTYGGITISINHYPDNIFRSAYDVYFPVERQLQKHSHLTPKMFLWEPNLR